MPTAPIISTTIGQNFFIEPSNGAPNQSSYLNDFPDAVYNKSPDSHLSILLSVLLGYAGAGFIVDQYLQERLRHGASSITGTDLDDLYTSAFGFARAIEESYTLDLDAQLLPIDVQAQVLAADSDFRNRAQLWLRAVQAGGSTLGLSLAASSGLGSDVEVFENYRSLYDQFCDIPLNVPYLGSSTSINELILLPRNNTPLDVAQSFYLANSPTSGYFSITVPRGPSTITVNAVVQSAISSNLYPASVPDTDVFSVGSFVTLYYGGVYYYTTCQAITGPQSVQLASQGAIPILGPGIYYTAYVSQSQTIPLPFNATASQVTGALRALPLISGTSGVICSGGPLPDTPIEVLFYGALADMVTDPIRINTEADSIGQIGPGLAFSGLSGVANVDYIGNVEPTASTLSSQGLETQFAPQDVQAMLTAVDVIRPQTTFITANRGQSLYTTQRPSAVFADQNYTTVLRYVTGNINVVWPNVDGYTHWIQPGVEHEAPTLAGTYSSQYCNFHEPSSIIAYNDQALTAENYYNASGSSPFWIPYYDTHIGQFNQAQQALFPFLARYLDSGYIFEPQYALAYNPNLAQITNVTNQGEALLDGAYPLGYLGLSGVSQTSYAPGPFWSSVESTSGTDYLEIDLGSPQAINFIYLEGTNKPFEITVDFDVMDQAPSRNFVPASISYTYPSVTALDYLPSQASVWTSVYLPVANPKGGMIYSRFIRIGFKRNASTPPFVLTYNTSIPYSIEVRNLRIGRLINDVPAAVSNPQVFTGPSTLYPSSDLYPGTDTYPTSVNLYA